MYQRLHHPVTRTDRRPRRVVAASIVSCAVLALAACGSSSDGEGSTGGGGEDSSAIVTKAKEKTEAALAVPTALPITELGAFTPKPGATLFVVNCDPQFEGCAKASAAIVEASKVIGYDVKQCATSVTNPDSTLSCFTNAVNAKPDVIIPIGLGENESGGGYSKVVDAGIPILGMVAANEPGKSTALEYAGPSWNVNEGRLIAYWDIAQSEGKAKALVPVINSNNSIRQRYEGMKEVFDQCSTCELKKIEVSAAASADDISKQLVAALQSNPDFTYLNTTVGFLGTVALDAVKQSGRADVKVTSTDGSSVNLAAMKKGELALDIGLPNVEDGWAAVDLAARLYSGEKVPEQFDDLAISLTPDNIDDIDYAGPTGFRDEFKKLWGK